MKNKKTLITGGIFSHRIITVKNTKTHVVEAGINDNPAIFFLHGWPQNWFEFSEVMLLLSKSYHVIAIDLPGIGESTQTLPSGDKMTIATFVHDVIKELGLSNIIVVGHDVGGMVAYTMLKLFSDMFSGVIIIDVAIPGVAPWEEVKRNPNIWHFAFHATKSLPEKLVRGNLDSYFGYFFNTLSASPGTIPAVSRKSYIMAYTSPAALQTGFDWYRAFPQDEKDNQKLKHKLIDTPLLYVRGDHDHGNINDYLEGFREHALTNISSCIISDCGHFAAEEQPEQVATAIKNFIINKSSL